MRVYAARKWPPPGKKSFCVLEYHTSKCVVTVQRAFQDGVFISPLPHDLADLNAWITAAVKNIDAPLLTRVWQELEYHINVFRVTRGAHIEHL